MDTNDQVVQRHIDRSTSVVGISKLLNIRSLDYATNDKTALRHVDRSFSVVETSEFYNNRPLDCARGDELTVAKDAWFRASL